AVGDGLGAGGEGKGVEVAVVDVVRGDLVADDGGDPGAHLQLVDHGAVVGDLVVIGGDADLDAGGDEGADAVGDGLRGVRRRHGVEVEVGRDEAARVDDALELCAHAGGLSGDDLDVPVYGGVLEAAPDRDVVAAGRHGPLARAGLAVDD